MKLKRGRRVFESLAGSCLAVVLASSPPPAAGEGRLLEVTRLDPSDPELPSPSGAALHDVIVANDFFSPALVEVDVCDTVRWTNASGHHNVFSCLFDEAGCGGETATESFTSGPPADPLWVFSHTFAVAGSNLYVCQPHAPGMVGRVTVAAPAQNPPAVPDGGSGRAMRVEKLGGVGDPLSLSWDSAGCLGAIDHQLIFGFGSDLPAGPGGSFDIAGSTCAIGTSSPYPWTEAPLASLDPSGLLWWVLVATDGACREGPWGRDSLGVERVGPAVGGGSGRCGVTAKDLASPCAR